MQLTPYQEWLATRSAIPKVIGILGIIFACIGAAMSALWTWGPLDDLTRWDYQNQWSAVEHWLRVWGYLSFGMFALHLGAAICALNYRPIAPKLVTLYSGIAIGLCIADVVVMFAWSPSSSSHYRGIRESVVILHVVYSALALPWPLVAALLINRKSAKAACVIIPQ